MLTKCCIKVRKERCNNCHVCIAVCPVKDCIDGSGSIIGIKEELCIACGRCVKACTRRARYFIDDTGDFFAALAAGRQFVVLASPSVRAVFENTLRLNGWLHSLGVRAVFDAAFGGDLSVLAYNDYIHTASNHPVICSTCPVVVTYCKIYKPDLIPHLAKIPSPVIFTALLVRQFFPQFDDCDIVALTPCAAKKREFEVEGYVKYNVTLSSLRKYMHRNNVDIARFAEKEYEGPRSSFGMNLPVPYGINNILKTISRGKIQKTRAYWGETSFLYLNELSRTSGWPENPLMVDCHNCQFGCYRGTAAGATHETVEKHEGRIAQAVHAAGSLARRIEHLKNIRKYYHKTKYPVRTFLSSAYLRKDIKQPDDAELKQIYKRMKKSIVHDDAMNCQACGYQTCRKMATAIFNGFNKEQNCRHYLRMNAAEKTKDLRRQTKKAQQLARKAQEASESKAMFLANMSHEIRTPMNAIIGMSTLFRTDNLDKTQEKYLNDIKKTSNSLLGIINDILDFSKIEAGKTELVPVHFNLRSLFGNICSISQYLITGKNCTFKNNIARDVPEWMYADEIRIRQICTNLISNAIKYTNSGFVRFSLEKAGERILIKVSDSGIGIKEEDLDKLFSSFQRLDEKKNRTIKGTGLGLVICKHLIELMGGTINVASVYGKGSTFTVALPFYAGDENMAELHNSRLHFVRARDDSGARILVVDDAQVNLVVALGFLEMHNLRADTASSGQEALARLKKTRYDLVFMDHMMPEMDGTETTREIRRLGADERWRYCQNVPVVALTANAVEGVKEQFLNCGMNDFISKPIEADALNTVLARWLPADMYEFVKQTETAARTDADDTPGIPALRVMLQAVEGLDVDEGIRHAGGSAQTYRVELRQFCADIPAAISTLQTSAAAADWRNFAITVHALKTAFAAIGCPSLSGVAKNLEYAAKDPTGDNQAFCTYTTPEFTAQAKAFLSALRSAAGALFKEAAKEKTTRAAAGTQFALLKAALAAYDMPKIDAAIQKLRAISVDSETDARIAAVIELVESASYQEAADLIEGQGL